jgi:hypothetical protein
VLGFLRGVSKVPQYLTQVQFQRTPFALDLFDLVVEHLLGLLCVFELRL